MRKDLLILEVLQSGRYEVTPDGEIFDLNWRNTGHRKRVATRVSRGGYLITNLSTGHIPRQITVSVHRVVALLFLGIPDEGRDINHLNGVKTDNRALNIEWCDKFENMRHASASGLLKIHKGSTHANAKLDEDTARAIKAMLSSGKTPCQILKLLPDGKKVSRAAIRQIESGRSWRDA